MDKLAHGKNFFEMVYNLVMALKYANFYAVFIGLTVCSGCTFAIGSSGSVCNLVIPAQHFRMLAFPFITKYPVADFNHT